MRGAEVAHVEVHDKEPLQRGRRGECEETDRQVGVVEAECLVIALDGAHAHHPNVLRHEGEDVGLR